MKKINQNNKQIKSKWTVINGHNFDNLVASAVDKYGLPTIENELAIYFKDGEAKYEIKLTPSALRLIIKIRDKNGANKLSSELKHTPRKIYSLIKSLSHIQASSVRCDIAEAEKLIFHIDNDSQFILTRDAIPGSIAEIKSKELDVIEIRLKKDFKLDFDSVLKARESIPERSYNEILIDSFGVIHPKIFEFCKRNGIVISNYKSINHILESKSNDYSLYEEIFYKITNTELLSKEYIAADLKSLPGVSIVIPSYNSEKSINFVLESINSQNYPNLHENVEVIVIDDGSNEAVAKYINSDYNFNLKLFRNETNIGLSEARKIGLNIAKNEIVVFIDSDILLSEKYLYEMVTRATLIPNGIFVSFKENIEDNHPFLRNIKLIKKGLPKPSNLNDKRIMRDLSISRFEGIAEKSYIEVLAETMYFKLFGFGTTLGSKEFDLPSMIVGHNFVVRKDNAVRANGFSSNFKGWGLEDSYLGACVIASGNFVIPVLSTGVYHIDHPPRSISSEKQIEEFKRNYKVYNNLLNENPENIFYDR